MSSIERDRGTNDGGARAIGSRRPARKTAAGPTDDPLARNTVEAFERARGFLRSLRLPAGGFRFGPLHDEARWPSMVLPGTYDAVLALRLLGEAMDDAERDLHAAAIRAFEAAGGAFRMPQMTPDTTYKRDDPDETRMYVDFHVTNYALGALAALDRLTPLDLAFVRPYLDRTYLEAWLGRRDLRDPWLEGNNLVNLGSFLLLVSEHGSPDERRRAHAALETLMVWHDRHQDPTTGFWGPRQHASDRDLLHAMAGATHDYHLYYALGRPVPNLHAAVDYCLGLPSAVVSACIDVDVIDILVHAALLRGMRVDDVRDWCARWLRLVLAAQNPDGGFPDQTEGVLRFDGWVAGYWEPQGASNAFATWFRCIAIAMCASVLWPGWRSFGFRDMVGIGYARLGDDPTSPEGTGMEPWTS